MKSCTLFLFCLLLAQTLSAQTLITVGKQAISKDEFLRAYNKNRSTETDRGQSVRDYVELYASFKLKVLEARSMGLDSTEQLKADLDNFRRQVEENYLHDATAFEQLLKQAAERSQQDLHLIRYSIPVEDGLSPSDTLSRYNAINDFYEAAKPTENLKIKNLDPSIKKVDMGFITVFSLPYAIENIAYQLQKAEMSKPYRTKNGWHVFQLVSKRPSAGKWKVAQLLFSAPADADEKTKQRAASLADSVYGLLMKGVDFSALVKTYSDDKLTYLNGGELPEFGTGKYDAAFEQPVMAISKDGEYSKPFQTTFGWHIVRRISVTPTPASPSDEGLRFDLKQKLLQDNRLLPARERFANDVIARIGLKSASSSIRAACIRTGDSIFNDPASVNLIDHPLNNTKVLTFKKGVIKGDDWIRFVSDIRANPETYKNEMATELWDQFMRRKAMDYYRSHLETYNTEFAAQVQEFIEGNMLFDIMERTIWSVAASDTAALRAYYTAHREQYRWDASADVILMNAISESAAKDAMNAMQSGKHWMTIIEQKQGETQGDSSRFELTQIVETPGAQPGDFSAIQKNVDGTASFVQYIRFYPKGDIRSLDDARGLVINDYQGELEKKWVATLRKKYPVKVQESVLQSILRP
ncbi:MAG: peptidylprolyl isomerase [Ferruginibacter sp.]